MRPDNAPICAFVASDNGPAFVTLRGGGLFVVNHTDQPDEHRREYKRSGDGYQPERLRRGGSEARACS